MARLEELEKGAIVGGVLPSQLVTVIDVTWFGKNCLQLTYRDAMGSLGNELLYRDSEASLELATEGLPWSFDGEGDMFRLASEARRISLAHLFDPMLAVHTSLIEPLPHQITAVYEEMLPRQPLRFLLADDPGAGKTIMAGMFIRELRMRGDVVRCLICCPGSLVEQWQDEMYDKFHLPFEIMTREKMEASRSGNFFAGSDMVICRMHQVAWNDEYLAKVGDTMYIETGNSGQIVPGVAGSLGRGTINSGVLELSNVDLATEFTNLIIFQRGFQANARIITTGDQVLNELVNLIR